MDENEIVNGNKPNTENQTDFDNTKDIETGYESEYTENIQEQNTASFTSENVQPENTQHFYTENYRKSKSDKHNNILKTILISFASAFLGGAIVLCAMVFVVPSALNTLGIATGNSDGETVINKVEITKSTSPVTAIAEKIAPSIVGIRVTVASQTSGFFFDVGQDLSGEGSGIIIRQDGYILTNNHVIENALSGKTNKLTEGSKIEVILPYQTDKSYVATVIGRDTQSDIAVLKITAIGLPVAELGNSDNVKVGELAVAIGNPGGIDLMGSITSGIISGLNRTVTTDDGQTLTLIQTDAAINPGNSGGALCNSKGQVIGVNTVKITATGFEGLGFAIPINSVKSITKSLIDYTYVKGRPYLGVSIDQRFTTDVATQYKVPEGLLVYEVTPLSAAYKAGIKAGDIITKFDGVAVTEFSILETQKNKHKPGDKVSLIVYRDGKTLTLNVTLDEDTNQ